MENERKVEIDGLEKFPFEYVGLSKNSIKRRGKHVLIPVELVPYLKLCITPVSHRIRMADYLYEWRKNRDNGKSPKRGRRQ